MHAIVRKHIGSTWSSNTYQDSPLAAAQSLLLRDIEGYRRSQHLNNDQKQAIQTLNKIVHQTVPKYLKIVLKDSTQHYECVSTRIT
jgi:hypothetical protein